MDYVERYITKNDLDNLDKSCFNDKFIRIFRFEVNNYTEKVHIDHSLQHKDIVFGHNIIKPDQMYGFVHEEESLIRDFDVKARKDCKNNKKIYLPDTFLNMKYKSKAYFEYFFYPDYHQRKLILDLNNKLELNHLKVLRR